MAGTALRSVSHCVGPQVVELVVTAPRAPVVRARSWVGLNAFLGEVSQPAPPGVLLECWALVSVEPGLSKAIPV
eukprot:8737269-Alexandrium_andersonii.AAC.1